MKTNRVQLFTCVCASIAVIAVLGFPVATRAGDGPGSIVSSAPLPAPANASAWKIVYRSTGLHGESIEVSGMVIAPAGAAPTGGRPVVAWAHATTGVAEKCAPSLRPDPLGTIPHLSGLLQRGFVVVATDYPGLGNPGVHPYLVGESEGRAVLDSVRAAGNISEVSAGKRFAVWGHSQGGHAALFTGQMVSQYAPELTLVGIAAVAPATDLSQLLKNDIQEPVGRVLTSYAVYSWSEVFQAPMQPIVHAPAIPIVKRVAGDCAEGKDDAYKVSFDSLTLTPRMLLPGFYNAEPWNRILTDNAPGRARAGAPVFVAQGTVDKIVEPTVTQNFVQGLCSRGEKVTFEPLQGVGHMTAGLESADAAAEWMAARFDGKPVSSTCGK